MGSWIFEVQVPGRGVKAEKTRQIFGTRWAEALLAGSGAESEGEREVIGSAFCALEII